LRRVREWEKSARPCLTSRPRTRSPARIRSSRRWRRGPTRRNPFARSGCRSMTGWRTPSNAASWRPARSCPGRCISPSSSE